MASTLFLAAFIGLWVYALVADPNLYSYPEPKFFHVSIGNVSMAVNKEDGGRVVFYNGPIPNAHTSGFSPDNVTFYEGCGIYFLLINVTASKVTWWTLIISFWYPVIIFAILPAIYLFKRLFRRKFYPLQK